MHLIKIEIERLNETQIEHKIVDSEEEIEAIKKELLGTKKELRSDPNFVGIYDYYVEEIDINSISDVSELKISLKDLKRLLEYID